MAVNLETKPDTSFKQRIKPGSIEGLNLISKHEYRSVLSKLLPKECFIPDIKHVFHYLILMSVYLGGIFSIVNISFFPLKLIISLVMGVSLAGLTFFLHDLFHGSIIKSKPIAYLFGLSVGIFNMFAPLFWQRVHNFHHARTGNIDDPDRAYIAAEIPKTLIGKFGYRNRVSSEAFHPIISLFFMSTGFLFYFSNTMFYGLVAKKSSIEEDKKYQRVQELFKSNKSKLVVIGELIIILSFQWFLFTVIANNSFLNYFLLSLLPVGISHFIAMAYIHTNHFLSPLTGEIDDPLVNSLSVKNSWFVDKIFSNFSHHAEHHLFPAMGSYHYPKVRKLLLNLYPGRYKLIPMIDAMKMLLKTPRIYGDYTHLVSMDGSKKINCLLPTS